MAAAIGCYLANGADPGPAGPITAGQGWDFLHRHSSDDPLAPGDIVHLELTPRIHGYSARIMRCVVVGGASAKSASQCRIGAAGYPDRRDAPARRRKRSMRCYASPCCVRVAAELRQHLGLYAWLLSPASPHTSDFTRCFHPSADWCIEAGMVFHMYVSAQGVSLSETVLITADGPERLT